jgi:hypothetical protein
MMPHRKKPDPLSDRARDLGNEIAALEAEIKRLSSQPPAPVPAGPKFRSTATPHPAATKPAAPPQPPAEPVFEDVSRNTVAAAPVAEQEGLYNELGVRKYDLPALIARLRNRLRSPTTSNPRLINYLAVGSVQGLRPLRYEKRVARDRFIILVVIFLAILTGLSYLLLRH